MTIKKISCIGAGFKGGTFSSVVALKCPGIEVHVIDQNKEQIEQWNSDKIPVFEPELEEIVKKCRDKNLFFTADVAPLNNSDIIFVCGDCDASAERTSEMKVLEDATRLIVNTVDCSKIIVEKSTAAVQAGEMMSNILRAYEEPYRSFTLISNPEFLIKGCAVDGLLNPDRVLIGGDNTTQSAVAIEDLISLYENWVPPYKIITTDLWSAELSNLVESAFLAQAIIGINSMSEICEGANVDINQVAEAVGMDSRIGVKDLQQSIGFRSVSFSTTIQSIIYLCKYFRLPEVATYWEKLLDINEFQKQRFVTRIMDAFCNSVVDRCMVVLGFSLKKNTTCTENSAGAFVSGLLLKEGVKLNICDPVLSPEVILKELTDAACDSPLAKKIPNLVKTFSDPYEAANGAQAIILCTDLPQFVSLDFHRIYNGMVKPAYVFDGNNILQHSEIQSIGFQVLAFGKNIELSSASEFY